MAGPGSGGAGGGDSCGAIGSPCSRECPDGLTCSGTNSTFCAPANTDCGGFAGKRCPSAFPVCLHYSGADYGLCATQAEADCICKTSPGAVTCP